MSALASTVWLALLLGWMAWGALSLGLEMPVSLVLGLALGVVCAALFRDTLVLRGLIAVLAPVGIVMPLLILRQMAGHLGAPVQPFGGVQIGLFVLFYATFLAAAAGAIPVDLYRLGFAPWPVAIMVLALCALGLVQGSLFVPVLAVAAQAIWVIGWGSSNWFDQVLHPMLIPAAIIVLVLRLF